MYMYAKGIVAQQKFYGFKNYEKLEVQNFFFKIKAGRTVFNFSIKTSFFLAQVGVLFE